MHWVLTLLKYGAAVESSDFEGKYKQNLCELEYGGDTGKLTHDKSRHFTIMRYPICSAGAAALPRSSILASYNHKASTVAI